MSNYLEKFKHAAGAHAQRNAAHVAQVLGSTPVIGTVSSSLSTMLQKAKASAPQDVKSGVGTFAGGVAGAIIGYHYNHPVLGGIEGASLARNVPALFRSNERKLAMRNLVITQAGVFASAIMPGGWVLKSTAFIVGSIVGGAAAFAGGLK